MPQIDYRPVRPADNGCARFAGLAQLGAIAAGGFTDMAVRASLIVPGSGRETARNIADFPWLYRLGTAGDVAMLLCELAVIAALHTLLRNAAPFLSRLAALIALTGVGLLACGLMLHLYPLLLLDDTPHPGIGMGQVQSLIRLTLALQGQVHALAMLFLGTYALLIGIIAWRSRITPRWIAALAMVGGLLHIGSRAAALLVPALSGGLPSQFDLLPLAGEGAFALWLLAMGVDQAVLARSATAIPATASTAPDAASAVH